MMFVPERAQLQLPFMLGLHTTMGGCFLVIVHLVFIAYLPPIFLPLAFILSSVAIWAGFNQNRKGEQMQHTHSE